MGFNSSFLELKKKKILQELFYPRTRLELLFFKTLIVIKNVLFNSE